jgi:hypothetical protein
LNPEPLIRLTRLSAKWLERLLTVAIVSGIIAFGVASAAELLGMDWRSSETIYDLMYRVLLMVIGVELARTLLTHDLGAILELLVFVVARKTLKSDVEAFDIFLCALAFVALLAARYHFLRRAADQAPEQTPP